MRITQEHVDSLYDAEVVDQHGDKIGGVGQVYLDDATGDPAWVTVRTGLLGTRESFVPLANADMENGRVQVPYEKDVVKDAPTLDVDQHLDEGQEEDLYRYYGLLDTGSGRDVPADRHEDDGSGPLVDRTDTGTAVGTAPLAELDRRTGDDLEGRGDGRVETGRSRLRRHAVEDRRP